MTSRMTYPPQPGVSSAAEPVPLRPAQSVMAEFDAFYAANISKLSSVLGATLNDRDLGAEAAAEAMVRACERWAKIRTHPNLMGWCYRVGFNWATSRWRRRRRESITDPATLHGLPGIPATEVNHQLHDAVRALPVDQRAVVILRYWLGWTGDEIAEALNIAPGTVGSRLNRALAVLRSYAAGADQP